MEYLVKVSTDASGTALQNWWLWRFSGCGTKIGWEDCWRKRANRKNKQCKNQGANREIADRIKESSFFVENVSKGYISPWPRLTNGTQARQLPKRSSTPSKILAHRGTRHHRVSAVNLRWRQSPRRRVAEAWPRSRTTLNDLFGTRARNLC